MSFDLETEDQTGINLDDAIDDDRSYPNRCSVRYDITISKTTVPLREDQHKLIQYVGMNFIHCASAVFSDRIEIKQAIPELGGMDAGE